MTDEVAALVLRDNYEQNVAARQRPGPGALDAPGAPAVHPRARASAASSTARWSSCPTDARDRRARRGRARGSPRRSSRCCSPTRRSRSTDDLLDVRRCPTSRGSRRRAARLLPAAARRAVRATGSTRTRCAARSSRPCVVNDMVNRGGITFVVPRGGGDRRRRRSRSRAPTRSSARSSACRDFWAPGRGARQRRARPRRRPRSTWSAGGCSTARPAGCCRPRAPLARRRRPRSSTSRAVSAADAAGPADAARRRARAARSGAPPSSSALGAPADLARETAAHARRVLAARRRRDRAQRPARAAEQVGAALLRAVRAVRGRPHARPGSRRCRATTAGHALARMALRYDLYAALAGLTAQRARARPRAAADPDERIAAWEDAATPRVWPGPGRRWTRSRTAETFDLATLSVALRVIRTLVPSGSSA